MDGNSADPKALPLPSWAFHLTSFLSCINGSLRLYIDGCLDILSCELFLTFGWGFTLKQLWLWNKHKALLYGGANSSSQTRQSGTKLDYYKQKSTNRKKETDQTRLCGVANE